MKAIFSWRIRKGRELYLPMFMTSHGLFPERVEIDFDERFAGRKRAGRKRIRTMYPSIGLGLRCEQANGKRNVDEDVAVPYA